jgi:hypothetical protein
MVLTREAARAARSIPPVRSRSAAFTRRASVWRWRGAHPSGVALGVGRVRDRLGAEEIDIETDLGTEQTAYGGIDFANLSGGVDFAVSRSVIFGPFGGVGFSMYLYRVQAVDGVGVGEAIEDPALHGWIQLGLRAALVL